jgi:hypothetical protein
MKKYYPIKTSEKFNRNKKRYYLKYLRNEQSRKTKGINKYGKK